MNKNKILFVDDELKIRETITELLIHENYDVKSAKDGHDALEILENWIPDLIICDISMPVMDGYSFHEIIRHNRFLETIPFVFLTAKNDNNEMRECLLNGADDFITKPFKVNELIQTIETKINRFDKIKNSNNNFNISKNNFLIHEINTPLSGILGSIDILIENEDYFEKNEIATFYDTIKTSGERLNRTMQNLILYQNLKNNSVDFSENSTSEILETFNRVKNKILRIHENQEKRIRFDVDPSNIEMNQNHLYFILFELIDNALKFSPNDKTIFISGLKYNEQYYELTIIDSGIGFSEDELKKIDATKQFNREIREQQGLGLGLFLSKIIIEKKKGVFSIISKVNEGTKISIFLPLK
jgi:CheY-like chemotaxis protein